MERRTVSAHKVISAILRRAYDWPNPASGPFSEFNADSQARLLARNLGIVGFEIVRKPEPGASAEDRVEYARRTGCWDGVTDRDYRTWLASLQQTIVPPSTTVVLTTEDHITGTTHVLTPEGERGLPDDAGIVGIEERPITDREISDMLAPGYHKALYLIRGGHPSASEVADALGGEDGDGPEGNVWKLFDDRYRKVAARTAFSWTQRPPEAVTLEPGKIEELPPGTKMSKPDTANAVRDLITAVRLIDRAEAVLGDEAVDDILNALNGIGDAEPLAGSEAA